MTIWEFLVSLWERPFLDYAYAFGLVTMIVACAILCLLFVCEIWPKRWRGP